MVLAGALDGIRVLEFSEMIAAPFAGMHLGDLGADIIKVEPPAGEPWRLNAQFAPTESRTFLSLNRNKRDLAIDLKRPEGQDVIRRLVPSMDVVLVNYRPDTPANLGIDYESLRALNERLIYVENTAMGRRGPQAHRPGYDLVAQAVTGLLLTGARRDDEGMPLPLTPAIADYGTGLTMAFAVCAALFARERTGRGQKIEATLLATALALQTNGFMRTGIDTGRVVDAETSDTKRATRAAQAYYRAYRTRDSMIAIACLTPVLRRKMADAIEVVDPRHSRDIPRDSPEGVDVAIRFADAVTARMLERTTADWLEVFDAAGVPAGAVNKIGDLPDDPQVLANDLVVEFEHPITKTVSLVGPLFTMSDTPTGAQLPPPTLGQHNDEILAELGYSADEVGALRDDGVIR
jgi:formyl-CoA transferase